MIKGVGVDTARVSRLAASIRRPHFVKRVFGEAEQALLARRPGREGETAAVGFAAKEAFLKAAGTGLGGFALAEIQALRNESGAPYYRCTGTAGEYLQNRGLRAHLSLTHEGDFATAFCILEKISEEE